MRLSGEGRLVLDDAACPPFYAKSTGIEGRITRWQDIEHHAPCLYLLHSRIAPAGVVPEADGSDPKTRPAAKFYLDRDGEPNVVTKDVSRLFLGMNLQCAQCHDHPLVADYKQEFYYGLIAFLNRSYIAPDPKMRRIVFAEKAEGEVSFQSVFDPAKVTKTTGPRVPGRAAVKEVSATP